MNRIPLAMALVLLSGPALAEPEKVAQATPPADAAPPPAPKPAEPAKPPLFNIYGTLNVNFQVTQAEGATTKTASVKSRTSVSTDSSNLGVKGVFDLPQGFQVVYQCETSAAVDGISASGICNRNSRLGVGGPTYGTLFYGNWDTPYKSMAYGTKADDPFLNTDVYGFDGLMSSPGFNYRSGGWSTASNTATFGFDIRANNSIGYISPPVAGFTLKLQYSADEFKNASGTQDPTLYSASLGYDWKGLSVVGAYERHEDGFALVGINPAAAGTTPAAATFGATAGNTAGSATAAIHSSDSAWRVGAGYQLDTAAGATTVGALYEQLMLEQSKAPTGALKKYERAAWQVSLKHRAGNHELRARYSMADQGKCTFADVAGCSAKDHGATNLAIGYAYYLAKTAQVYLHFAMMQNEKAAQYTFPIGGSPAVAGATPAGADPLAVGLGIRYGF